MSTTTFPPLTAYRVHRSDGTSYVTDMAAGVTLAQARAYFIGSFQWDDPAETKGARVTDVTDADRTEWHAEQAQFHADKNAAMEALA